MCHFLDLTGFLGGGSLTRVHACALRNGKAAALQDSLVVAAELSSGSVATITYAAEGDTAYPKELVEVFCGGSVAVIDDFRRVTIVEGGKTERHDAGKIDKGHAAEMRSFLALAAGREAPGASFSADVAASDAAFAVVESLCRGAGVDIPVRDTV